MATAINMLVTADPVGNLSPAVNLLSAANREQRESIGWGLGLAATACRRNSDADAARRITEALRARDDTTAMTAFNLASDPGRSGASTIPPVASQGGATGMGALGALSSPDTAIYGTPWRDKLIQPIAPRLPR